MATGGSAKLIQALKPKVKMVSHLMLAQTVTGGLVKKTPASKLSVLMVRTVKLHMLAQMVTGGLAIKTLALKLLVLMVKMVSMDKMVKTAQTVSPHLLVKTVTGGLEIMTLALTPQETKAKQVLVLNLLLIMAKVN